MGFPSGSAVKYLPAVQEMQETQVWSPGWEDPLEEERATHSSGSHSHWPGRSHGQRNVGYSPCASQRVSTAEHTCTHKMTYGYQRGNKEGRDKLGEWD